MATNVPAIGFTQTGVVLPTDAAILAGVQADINAAFGGGVNPALSTPQGQLASSIAAVVSDKNANIANLLNQVDPQFASGRMQDAIGNIYFLTRFSARATVTAVTINGSAGVVIPAGAKAIATDGTIFINTGAVTIPIGGTIAASFQAITTGTIACPAGTLNAIYGAIPGWDTITNATDGVIGQPVESRAAFEFRRQQSVALNAIGSLPSIYAAVFAVANVTDVYIAENVTNNPVVNGSITLAPHSIYVAAVGGLAQDIANAIWKKKSVGADYNGNTSVSVTDASGYAAPLPTYTVRFQVPQPQPIYFAVRLANLPTLPANIVTLVQNAIISAFAGGDGGSRARVGSTLYASRYYAPLSAIAPAAVEILSLFIATTPTPTLAALTVDIGVVPTVSAANISVTLV